MNWVVARINCTIADVFRSISQHVSEDVARFNGLPPSKRDGRCFITEGRDNGIAICRAVKSNTHPFPLVVCRTHQGDFVFVDHTDNLIFAERLHERFIEVIPNWNAVNGSCDLGVNGSAMEPWMISQRIVGDFMFDGLSVPSPSSFRPS